MLHQKTFTKNAQIFLSRSEFSTFQTSFTKSKTFTVGQFSSIHSLDLYFLRSQGPLFFLFSPPPTKKYLKMFSSTNLPTLCCLFFPLKTICFTGGLRQWIIYLTKCCLFCSLVLVACVL